MSAPCHRCEGTGKFYVYDTLVECECQRETIESLRARVAELEAGEQEARLAVMRMKDDDQRIRELEAVVAADDLASHVIEYRARIKELEEREKHTQATYEETGQKIIDQHNQIQELMQLVRLLKRDAADGTSNQHFRDGAEAALRWAWVELIGFDGGLLDGHIKRGLRAVCGKENKD